MIRIFNSLVPLLLCAGLTVIPAGLQAAESAPKAVAAADYKVQANLKQLMLGIFFASSNVVFAAQDDLSHFPEAEDASASPNPLTSTYGSWQAVENAALAMYEASNLLLLPGRVCSNGRPVPVQRPDWAAFVQVMRNAAAAAYKAARTRNQDAMVTVSDTLTQGCAACHDVYRDKKTKAGNDSICLQ